MEFRDKSSVVRGRPQESISLVEANPSSMTSLKELPERLSDSSPEREQKGDSAGAAGNDQTPELVRLSEVREERPEKAAAGTLGIIFHICLLFPHDEGRLRRVCFVVFGK